MRKAFMMIELLLVFAGLILLVNLIFMVLSQSNGSSYDFIPVDKECDLICVLEKPIH
jgi:hypothetical protein